MADVFTRNGVTLDMNAANAIPVRYQESFGATPTLTIQVRGGALPGIPDPWIGKVIKWYHDGTLYFTGDVVAMNPQFDQHVGWIVTYTVAGIRNRLDWFPHTDSATGLDVSPFNLLLTDPDVNLARSGRTVGQILGQTGLGVLLMGGDESPENPGNVQNLATYGVGNIGTGVLPVQTALDLTALTMIPPRPVYFGGEKFADAIDSLLCQWAPNFRWWVQPDGNFRFLDLRSFTANVLTMGTDPIEPTELCRDLSRCFSRVVVRGQPNSVMALLKLSEGQLTEDFAHDGLDNAAAKAAWTPTQFAQPQWSSGTAPALSSGTVDCTSTTTVNYRSSTASETWTNGYWDQSHQQGTLNLSASILGDSFTQFWSARIVSCTALTAGSVSTFTLDNPLPNTNYDKATITGLASGPGVVYTKYKIANETLWPRLTNQSTYPQAFVNSSGTGATVLSSPMGLVFRDDQSTFPLAYTFNTVTGEVRFIAPTYVIANNAEPTDVWIYQPVNTNGLYAVYPHDTIGPPQTANYSGTSYTVDGIRKTLTVTIDQWTDYGQFSNISAYAQDLWSSVSDAVVEGTVVYYGFYAPALTFGNAVTIEGQDTPMAAYATGWEGLTLPIREVTVDWPQTTGQDYITTMSVSNRRDVYSVEQFLKPPRAAGYSFGFHDVEGAEHGINVFAQAGEYGIEEGTGWLTFTPDETRSVAGPSTAGAASGINDYTVPGTDFFPSPKVPGGGGAFDESAGTGMPDFGGQLVAGEDFGAGIHEPKETRQADRIAGISDYWGQKDREAALKALRKGDKRLDRSNRRMDMPEGYSSDSGDFGGE